MNLYIGISVLVLMTIFILVMTCLCIKGRSNFAVYKSDIEDASMIKAGF